MPSTWTLQDAKNKFSEVVNAACAGAPQVVTKRGKPSVVVVSMTDYERFVAQGKSPAPRFTEFLLSMPGGGAEADTSREDIALREVDF